MLKKISNDETLKLLFATEEASIFDNIVYETK
jgi:hypothetical protein